MQPHTDLIMLVELHRQSLLAEGARARRARETDRGRRLGLRGRLAGLLVALALWLDRQEASAGLDSALARPRRLPGHA